MKTLEEFCKQINDPIRQQIIRFLQSEILLSKNMFNETLDLETHCLYKGQRELAMFIAEEILKNKSPYLLSIL